MISDRCLAHLRRLVFAPSSSSASKTFLHPQTPIRTITTTTTTTATIDSDLPLPHIATQQHQYQAAADLTNHVPVTLYTFPSMEPQHFLYYPHTHLWLTLRKDILHRAVIYEGDRTRQGSANTKWRDEVHGSHKKHHRQKGLGMARAGDKQSPIRVGGGVAFGPKPRDFATGLPRKEYDLAWRIALSYRYRRGELLVVDALRSPQPCESWFLNQVFEANGWGKDGGRTMFVAAEERRDNKRLFEALKTPGRGGLGRMRTADTVDVKNLLEMGRLVVEKEALDTIFRRHSRDLVAPRFVLGARSPGTGVVESAEPLARLEQEELH